MKLLAQGAESKVFQDNTLIIKERFSKKYRLPHLDESLRKFRTRREAKVLGKLEQFGFPSPHMQSFSDKRMSIIMDFVPGEKLKDVLLAGDDYQKLAVEIGLRVGELHQKDIVHGDLTTSNMIKHAELGSIHFVDFGLSFFSEKIEDKAVDLFLLDRALESTHFEQYPVIFESVIEGYRESLPEAVVVLDRLKAVQKRGRHKQK